MPRRNMPHRRKARREGALTRRTADIAFHTQEANSWSKKDPQLQVIEIDAVLTAADMAKRHEDKAKRAKDDVAALKKKLGAA